MPGEFADNILTIDKSMGKTMIREEFIASVNGALPCVRAVHEAMANLGNIHSERTNIALPLLLASLDTAEAALVLLKLCPERGLVPAFALQRVQIEHVFRAAFFASVANERELNRFLTRGKMPNRQLSGNRRQAIKVRQILQEVAEDLGFEPSELAGLVYPRYERLSALVHGGIEIPRIYLQNEQMGDLRLADWSIVMPEVYGIVAYVQMALNVAMMMSPLSQDELSATVQGACDQIRAYMPAKGE